MIIISVKDVLHTNLCIYRDQAYHIYYLVCDQFDQNGTVTLCFDGIDVIISHFLHPLLSELYAKYGLFLEDVFCVTGLSEEHNEFYNNVLMHVKEVYYA